VSVGDDEILYDLNGELALTPASNQKLFTSAAALHALGPEFTFTTRVAFDTGSSPAIFLRGSGDPILCTADLDSLAAATAVMLPRGRTWTVAGDASYFDDLPKGAGWTWDDEPDPTGMFISPLSLNGNTIRVLVRPGPAGGDPVRVTSEPVTSYVALENSAVTAPDSSHSSLTITRKWREHSNTITIAGSMCAADTQATETLSIAGPEWYTLTVFRERLEALGIRCGGLVLDTIPAGLQYCARISHRLDSVLTYMNLESDNLSAENVLKTIAAEKGGPPGSAQAGIGWVNNVLSGMGIDTTKLAMADGSGVSRYNLATAASITSLLVAMARSPDMFPGWYRSLPVAGTSGTLAQRMKATAAEGNLRAKTGTLRGTSSLSGYVTTADGELLAFSILMQHYPASARQYRLVQDRVGAFLASSRR
jgi:D-alanyl-D-alanine carboxypeptidase/D-alanyl-D-alanine-endopeptidase (penicillin-binding protein 4)